MKTGANERRIFLDRRGEEQDPSFFEVNSEELQELSEMSSTEFRELLRLVDFDCLQEIFYELYGRPYGLNKINFLGPERILSGISDEHTEPGVNAVYSPTLNAIHIFQKFLTNFTADKTIPPLARFVELVAHEESHAISFTQCRGLRKKERMPLFNLFARLLRIDTFDMRNGYAETKISDSRGVVLQFFKSLDEGVTELMGRGSAVLYFKRKKSQFPQNMIELYQERRATTGSYADNVTFVMTLIKKICEESGFSNDAVWKALVGGKLSGEIFDKEYKRLFDETFYPGFFKKLRKSQSATDLFEIIMDQAAHDVAKKMQQS